jgi:hypothetical protein
MAFMNRVRILHGPVVTGHPLSGHLCRGKIVIYCVAD